MLLEIENLKTHIDGKDGVVKAVDGVSMSVGVGETVGIVGESGSGKSMLALSLMQLNPKPITRYPAGEILLEGRNLLELSEKRMNKIRGKEISMIFQDPMTSLNPLMRIGDQIIESIRSHQSVSKHEAKKLAIKALGDVGIPNPDERISEYPHQFSGGMRQRAIVAMALSCKPKVLIADEPTTALDVTIQAQILKLIKDMQNELGTAVIMITHDLGVVAQIADRVNVMYSGRVVEEGSVNDIFYDPLMPYTKGLLESIPRIEMTNKDRLIPIQGQPPNLSFTPKGCNFSPRCPLATKECLEIDPMLEERKTNHKVACILTDKELNQQNKKIAY